MLFDAVQFGRGCHSFGRHCCFHIQDYSDTMKREAEDFSGKFVPVYQGTRRHIPENCNIKIYIHESLKCHYDVLHTDMLMYLQ
jgi:hypothetical protein